MALHLVTGYKGTAHITSADQGAFNAALIGTEDYVCKTGRQFEAQIMTNNSVRIYDGDLLMQGRHVNLKVDTYEDVTIENGAQGMNRNDLIVCRYAKDATSGQEAALFVVLKGTPTEGTASDPVVTSGDILGGAVLHEMPLYRVKIEGLSIVAIQKLYSVVSPVVDVVTEVDLKKHTDNKNNPHGVTAAQVGALPIGGGTLSGKLNISYTGYTKMPEVNRTDNNEVGILFSHGGIKNGTFGFSDDKPFVRLGDLISSKDNKYLYGEHNKDSMPFLPLTGGTLSGLTLGLNNGHGRIVVDETVMQIDHIVDKTDVSRRTSLLLKMDAVLSDRIRILDKIGSNNYYKIYGEHNVTCGTTEPTSLANGCIYEMYE